MTEIKLPPGATLRPKATAPTIKLPPGATLRPKAPDLPSLTQSAAPDYLEAPLRQSSRFDGVLPKPIARGRGAQPPSGILEYGNIDLKTRPKVKLPDGSTATVRSMSFRNNRGQEVLIPTISDDGRALSDQEAKELYGSTGRHLGIFDTPENANAYATRLHEDQEREYGLAPEQATDEALGITPSRVPARVGRGPQPRPSLGPPRAAHASRSKIDETSIGEDVESIAKGVPRGAVDFVAGTLQAAQVHDAASARRFLQDMDRFEAGELRGIEPYQAEISEEQARDHRAWTVLKDTTPEQRALLRENLSGRTVAEAGPLYQTGEEISKATKEQFPLIGRQERSTAYQVGQGFGQVGVMIPLAAAGPLGALTATAAGMANSGMESYRDAMRHGASSDVAYQAFTRGALVGATEIVPIAHLLSRIDKASGGRLRGAIMQGTIQAFEEGGQEGVQTFLGNVIARDLYDHERAYLQDVAHSAGIGALVGGPVGAGGGALARPQERQGAAPGPRREPYLDPERAAAAGDPGAGPGQDAGGGTDPGGPGEAAPPGGPGGAAPAPAGGGDPIGDFLDKQRARAERQRGGGGAPAEPAQPSGDGTRANPARVTTPEDAAAAGARAATSPLNTRREPTDKEKQAGNYPKAHFKVQPEPNGPVFDITIENPKGSKRSGVDPSGKPWEVEMPADYGYFKRSEGADSKPGKKEQIDVYLGPRGGDPEGKIFIVDQMDLETGDFDEHKVMFGYSSVFDAIATYERAFQGTDGVMRMGAINEISPQELKAWLNAGRQKKAYGDITSASAAIKEQRAAAATTPAANPAPGPAAKPAAQPAPAQEERDEFGMTAAEAREYEEYERQQWEKMEAEEAEWKRGGPRPRLTAPETSEDQEAAAEDGRPTRESVERNMAAAAKKAGLPDVGSTITYTGPDGEPRTGKVLAYGVVQGSGQVDRTRMRILDTDGTERWPDVAAASPKPAAKTALPPQPTKGTPAELQAAAAARRAAVDEYFANGGEPKVTPLRKALGISAPEANKLLREWKKRQPKKPRPARKPKKLLEMIVAKGGLKDKGGELRASDLGRKFVPGFGPLVRPNGMEWDTVAEFIFQFPEYKYLVQLDSDPEKYDADKAMALVLDLVAGKEPVERGSEAEAYDADQERQAEEAGDQLDNIKSVIRERFDSAGVYATPAEIDQLGKEYFGQGASALTLEEWIDQKIEEAANAYADQYDAEEAPTDREDDRAPGPSREQEGPAASPAPQSEAPRESVPGDQDQAGAKVEREGDRWKVIIGSTTYRGDRGRPFSSEAQAKAFAERWGKPKPRVTVEDVPFAIGDKADGDTQNQPVKDRNGNPVIASLEAARKEIAAGTLKPDPERVGQCYRFAGREVTTGGGHYVIGTVEDAQGKRIYHAVVIRDGLLFEPVYNRWFDPKVYSDAVGGLAIMHWMTPREAMAFGQRTGEYPDWQNQKLPPADQVKLPVATSTTEGLFDEPVPQLFDKPAEPKKPERPVFDKSEHQAGIEPVLLDVPKSAVQAQKARDAQHHGRKGTDKQQKDDSGPLFTFLEDKKAKDDQTELFAIGRRAREAIPLEGKLTTEEQREIAQDVAELARRLFGERIDTEILAHRMVESGGQLWNAGGALQVTQWDDNPVTFLLKLALGQVDARGRWTPLSPEELIGFLLHEGGIHYFRRLGILDGPRWSIFQKKMAEWRAKYLPADKIQAYRDHYTRQGRSPEEVEDMIDEEAVAFAIQHYKFEGARYGGKIDHLMAQFWRFIDRLKNLFAGHGFQDWRDVFDQISSGKLAKEADAARNAGKARVHGRPGSQEAIAHHGSRERFDKFSTAKIGTGEGHQSYGWGLYFASKKDIAEHYRKALSGGGLFVKGIFGKRAFDPWGEFSSDQAKIYVKEENYDIDRLIARLDAKYREMVDMGGKYFTTRADYIASDLALLRRLKKHGGWQRAGTTYTVDLAPKEDEYLLWDSRLSEQPQKVKDIIRNWSEAPDESVWDQWTGEELYFGIVNAAMHDNRKLRRDAAKKQASLELLKKGIRGNKYLDGGSRSAGDGSYNYVIFDEADVKIVSAEALKARHASPHTFDKFSTDAIGTGEGHQVLGWGLYFSTRDDVHKHYVKQFSTKPDQWAAIQRMEAITTYRRRLNELRNDLTNPINLRLLANGSLTESWKSTREREVADYEATIKRLEEGLDLLQKGKKAKEYKVTLEPNEEDLLDWDDTEQSPKVAAALAKIPESVWEVIDEMAQDSGINGPHPGDGFSKGLHLYGALVRYASETSFPDFTNSFAGSPEMEVSKYLAHLGIAGIKAWDAKSRKPGRLQRGIRQLEQQRVHDERGGYDLTSIDKQLAELRADLATHHPPTRNYVIFDDKHVTIDERFALGAPIADSADTDTKAFKDWFGDSKVTKDGKPRVVYHGTLVWEMEDGRSLGDIQAFDRMASVSRVKRGPSIDNVGSWFSTNPGEGGAEMYSGKGTVHGAAIYPVYLSIKTPWVTSWEAMLRRARTLVDNNGAIITGAKDDGRRIRAAEVEALRKWLKETGRDGIKLIQDKTGEFKDQEVWIALEPSQIKSAVGNTGAYSSASDDIRYALGPRMGTNRGQPNIPGIVATAGATQRLLDDIADDSRTGKARKFARDQRKYWQDYLNPWRRTQAELEKDTGAPTPDSQDVYGKAETFAGRVEERMVQLERQVLTPLAKAIANSGMELSFIEKYLLARHAEERNDYIASINPNMPDGGSGMTTQDARDFLASINANEQDHLDRIATYIDRLRRIDLEQRVNNGLIDAQYATDLLRRWPHYVPLQGEGDVEFGDVPRPKRGQGFSLKGREYDAALGREDVVKDIIGHMVAQTQEAIVRGEKNQVARAAARLIAQNPNDDFWKLRPGIARRKLNKDTGLVETVWTNRPNPDEEENHWIYYKDGGVTHGIWMADPDMARAFKGMNTDSVNRLIRGLMLFAGFLRGVYINWNVDFMATNWIRDMQDAQAQSFVHKVPHIRKKMLGYWPQALYASLVGGGGRTRAEGSMGAGSWLDTYREMSAAGGKVALFTLDDFEKARTSIEKAIKHQKRNIASKAAYGVIPGIFNVLDRMNHALETAIRLAAYRACREAGMTKQQAAHVAKNITINFNRRGEVGPQLSAIYLFANASIQGTYNKIKLIAKRPKTAAAIMGGLVAGGALQQLFGTLLSPPDEDERPRYLNTPDYIFARNIVIPLPGKDTSRFTVPLAYGLNVPWNAGRLSMAVAMGQMTPGEAMSQLARIASQAFVPVDTEGGPISAGVPTILKPPYELERNKDFTGSPIYREPFSDQEKSLPPSHLSRPSTEPVWRDVAEGINKATGGDDLQPGWLSLQPEAWRHLFRAYGGSVVDVPTRVQGFFEKRRLGQETSWSDIPILRKFLSGPSDQVIQDRFYDTLRHLEDVAEDSKRLRKENDPRIKDFEQEHKAELDMAGLFKSTNEFLSDRRKEIRQITADISLTDDQKKVKRAKVWDEMSRVVNDTMLEYERKVAAPERERRAWFKLPTGGGGNE